MTVGLNYGYVDYNKYVNTENYYNAKTGNSTTSIQNADQNDYFVSASTGNTCTDGNDDGKIGFFGAIGSAIKGVAKTAVNAVKGMFTDSEGKFSLGKTLLSAATVAACIAFPVVGFGLCAIGAVSGAATVAKGVYNAVTAETDAQAKDAWENIGGGALTTAVSVAGAKASYGAMKATSTAGANGGSAIESLEEGASIGTKAKAFLADAKSSTVNRANTIINAAKNAGSTAAEAAQYKISQHKGEANETVLSDEASALLDKAASAKESIQSAAKTAANAAKHPVQTVKAGLNAIKNVKLSDVSSALKGLGKNATDIFNTLKAGGYDEAVQTYGYDSVAEVLTAIAGIRTADEAI